MEERQEKGDSIVKNHVLWSMGAGLVPIPLLDIAAVSAVQLDMVRQLCRLYELDFSETQGKAMITSMTSSSLAKIGARVVAKFIPGIGSIIGGISMGILSGASTYALGEVYKKHFETGGTFLDFDPERFRKFYSEKFEKGKKVAEEWKKQQDQKKEPGFRMPGEQNNSNETASSNQSSQQDVLTQLKELGDLKQSGVITEEEFQNLKNKILSGANG